MQHAFNLKIIPKTAKTINKEIPIHISMQHATKTPISNYPEIIQIISQTSHLRDAT